mgnify:CR=1 FL=1
MKPSFPCPQCHKELSTKQRLRTHVKANHTETEYNSPFRRPTEIKEEKTPVGRPVGSTKDPSLLSDKTKQIYARKLTNEYKLSLIHI